MLKLKNFLCLCAALACCRDIMRVQAGLAEHHDNYHEFCRLLGRLKTNYQLSELVSWE
jgi:exportin-7